MSENWVLSAGHCCAGLGTGDIVAGGIDIYFPEGVEQHRTPDKFGHPDYDSATINNDVCLLKVRVLGKLYWTWKLSNLSRASRNFFCLICFLQSFVMSRIVLD